MEHTTALQVVGQAITSAIAAMPFSQLAMLLAMPLVLLLAAIEWWHFRDTDKFDARDTAASILMGSAYVLLAEGIVVILLVVPAYDWLFQFRLATQSVSLLSMAALFLIVDFCFYLFHLAAHRIRFLWGVHEVHHASECFNFTVAFRQSVLYAVVGVYLFFVPPILLGFSPEQVLLMLAINLVFQIFVHTQWVPRLHPAIEWTFNTPSNHRVHHARNPEYVDRNLGGTLMVWDHLFGTYAAEARDNPPEYGVVSLRGRSPGYNPVTLTFREYRNLLNDVARPGPLALRLQHLWAPPEWQRPDVESAPADPAPTPSPH